VTFSALTLLVGCQEEHLVRKKLSVVVVVDVVICQEQGAYDLHMIQLMPLPPIISCFINTQEWICLSGAGLPRLS